MRRIINFCSILSLCLVLTGCASIGGARTEETVSWDKVRGWLHLPGPDSEADSTSADSPGPAQPTGGADRGSFLRHWQTGMAP